MFWIGEQYGRMPDIIGVAEVENRWVLEQLLSSTLLRKHQYGIIHRNSRDRRGIDVALLYNRKEFEVLEYFFIAPVLDGSSLYTRDILIARMKSRSDGLVYDFIVNHHPSKFGGSKASEVRREAVMKSLVSVCDSLCLVSQDVTDYKGIIAMGDFNDTPDSPQFLMLDGKLENACLDLYERGEGTIRYEGKWELIDMFFVNQSILSECSCHILRIPFLMTYDRKHPGEKPLRTYSGPRYIAGVSDHCPVVLVMKNH